MSVRSVRLIASYAMTAGEDLRIVRRTTPGFGMMTAGNAHLSAILVTNVRAGLKIVRSASEHRAAARQRPVFQNKSFRRQENEL